MSAIDKLVDVNGRAMLRDEAEQQRRDLQTTLRDIATRAASLSHAGPDITADDLKELRESLAAAENSVARYDTLIAACLHIEQAAEESEPAIERTRRGS